MATSPEICHQSWTATKGGAAYPDKTRRAGCSGYRFNAPSFPLDLSLRRMDYLRRLFRELHAFWPARLPPEDFSILPHPELEAPESFEQLDLFVAQLQSCAFGLHGLDFLVNPRPRFHLANRIHFAAQRC